MKPVMLGLKAFWMIGQKKKLSSCHSIIPDMKLDVIGAVEYAEIKKLADVIDSWEYDKA